MHGPAESDRKEKLFKRIEMAHTKIRCDANRHTHVLAARTQVRLHSSIRCFLFSFYFFLFAQQTVLRKIRIHVT